MTIEQLNAQIEALRQQAEGGEIDEDTRAKAQAKLLSDFAKAERGGGLAEAQRRQSLRATLDSNLAGHGISSKLMDDYFDAKAQRDKGNQVPLPEAYVKLSAEKKLLITDIAEGLSAQRAEPFTPETLGSMLTQKIQESGIKPDAEADTPPAGGQKPGEGAKGAANDAAKEAAASVGTETGQEGEHAMKEGDEKPKMTHAQAALKAMVQENHTGIPNNDETNRFIDRVLGANPGELPMVEFLEAGEGIEEGELPDVPIPEALISGAESPTPSDDGGGGEDTAAA